jgi:N,N-dimethylformamidase beta subunit-like protein
MDNFVQKQGHVAVIVLLLLLVLQFVTSSESLQKYPAIAQHTIANNTNAISNLSKNNGHSELPQMTASGNNVYVIWLDDTLGSREIFLRRSTDGGNTFDSKIINLSKNNMEGGGGAFNPEITALANNVYVVWENTPDNNGQIFFSKSSDGGSTFSNPINLGNNTGFSGDPQIAVSKINYVYVVWHNTGDGISFRRSTDGGNTFDKVINLSNNNSLSFQPQIAISDKYDSYIYVIWGETHFYNGQNRQQHQPHYDIVFRKSTDRGETFEDRSINLANNSSGTSAFLRLATSQSNVYALWTNVTVVPGNILTDIVFAKSFDNGNKFDKAANINNYTGWSFDPQLAVFGNNVYVAWNENPHGKNGDIMFRRSNNNGTTFENKITNLSNSTGKNSFDHKIIVAQSQKNNVNDIYVVWNGDTTNGNKGTYLRSSINGGNTFDNVTNLSNNTDNDQSAPFQISLSKSNNNLYIAWDANTAANNEEIFFRQITAAMTTKTTIINHSLLYDNNKPSIIHLKEIGSNNTIISENANNNNKDIGTTAASNIAIIEPTFTAAAYDNAFYIFYRLYANTTFGTNITKHIGLLSNTITNETIANNAIIKSSQAAMDYLVSHIQWLMPKSNITVLADEDVHNGYIFKKEDGNKNIYDVIILGHQEYVTQKEYDYLKKFVTNGGTLFLMDSNALYAEVKYDNKTNTVTMAKGHSWAFNGKSAWKSVGERWAKETSEWVGSNYLCYLCDIVFNNNPFKYNHREEQYITNPKDKILLDYNASIIGSHNNDNNNNTMPYNVKNISQHTGTKIKIATYQLDYGKGKVISLGIYTDDIIQNFNSHNSKFNKFRDTLLLNLNYKFNKFLDTLLLKYTPVRNKQ